MLRVERESYRLADPRALARRPDRPHVPPLEREVDDAVAALSSLLEPIIIAFLGVVIGGLVVAMYLPIFKLGSVV